MRFFFAENLDTVDPNFDFESENNSQTRNRQSEDVYAHETLGYPPYDGLLVSRSLINSPVGKTRYSQGQRQRLFREGVRKFLRYPSKDSRGEGSLYPIMGDCGAFSYMSHKVPPFSVEETYEFYDTCGFTHGVSPDHVIADKNIAWDNIRNRPDDVNYRARLTLHNATEFFELCNQKNASFVPIGVVQSWSPSSATAFSKKLISIGYRYIGLGGLAARPTQEIYNTIISVRANIPSTVKLHVFGLNRIDRIQDFVGIGIDSFDSSSPMIKAFKDIKYNYFSIDDRHYTAIRIPPLTESKVNKRIQSGVIEYNRCLNLEKECFDQLEKYSRSESSLDKAVNSLHDYENYVFSGRDNQIAYARTLKNRPWENCDCQVCKEIGINALIFRGINRNKRRGYHNLHVFYKKLKEVLNMKSLTVPCIKTEQSSGNWIYSFIVNGKDISKFSSISRIKRNEQGDLLGYQRPEILDHVKDIKEYLDKENAILPNSIVMACNQKISFKPEHFINDKCQMGFADLPINSDSKIGWIVDGQQRIAALREIKHENFPVSVIAFESNDVEQEREQFVLVNNTKPLPKSLVYELLPSIGKMIPPKLKKRQKAYTVLERLNLDPQSPFYCRIKTITSKHLETANIKDMSVLKMIENSSENGVLYQFNGEGVRAYKLLSNFWSAVASLYEEAWNLSPKESRLTHGTGIVSMGYLMDTISYKLSGRWDIPPKQSFLKELRLLGTDIPWTKGHWSFSKDTILPWNGIQNTSKDIDRVTNYLIRKYKAKI